VLTLQIVPYFSPASNPPPKCAEEANPEFKRAGYIARPSGAALAGRRAFLRTRVVAVSYIAPWKAFSASASPPPLPSRQPRRALACPAHPDRRLLRLSNASRKFRGLKAACLFAYGRVKLFPAHSAASTKNFRRLRGHPWHRRCHHRRPAPRRTALLVPVNWKVGSMASAFGWLAACVSFSLSSAASGSL